MAGVEKDGARRRTCVISATCQRKTTLKRARAGETRWPGSVNTSRRVRPRGDGSHSRGQARRTIDETGDRDRAVEGAQSGRRSARAEEGDDIRTRTRRAAKRALRQGRSGRKRRHLHRVRAPRVDALKREGHAAASKEALARQARSSARKRSASSREAHRPDRRRGRRDQPFAVLLPSVPRPRVDAGRKPEKGRPEAPGLRVRHRTCFEVSRTRNKPVGGGVRRNKPGVKVSYSGPAPPALINDRGRARVD